jgi:hypothetical protein
MPIFFRGAPIEPGHQVIGPELKRRNVRRPAHGVQRAPCLVATPREPEADDADSIVGAADDQRLLDSQQPIDVTGHQQRLRDARRDVRVEPACFGVRGDGLFVEAAIATGVNEPCEQLGIVAVTVGPAQCERFRRPDREQMPLPSATRRWHAAVSAACGRQTCPSQNSIMKRERM